MLRIVVIKELKMKRMAFMGLIFGVMASGCSGDERDGIFHYKAGQFDIYMLVESQRSGNTNILVGADEALLNRYIPSQGFQHSANAFLIKGLGLNILIDTGTGSGGVILDKIKSLGVQPQDVDAILITHLHGDHFGSLQNAGRAVFPNAKIYISAIELEYFTKTNVNQGAVAALAPYQAQTVTFEPAQTFTEILPGVFPIAAYGHTPGHTIFQIENGGQKFLVIGDLLHIALVQFPVPEISATYDMDANASAAVRRQVLNYAAVNKIPVGGMHIVFPGAGTVEAEGNGFKFTPLD
jgi:glyoxylase-like metal-dependent hydrolase (beta-lactamase superfamily II)